MRSVAESNADNKKEHDVHRENKNGADNLEIDGVLVGDCRTICFLILSIPFVCFFLFLFCVLQQR